MKGFNWDISKGYTQELNIEQGSKFILNVKTASWKKEKRNKKTDGLGKIRNDKTGGRKIKEKNTGGCVSLGPLSSIVHIFASARRIPSSSASTTVTLSVSQ